ncbi:hypothetical protein DFQ27_003686 [Actinomortierella ambigua]|uniref:Uncharacterized protein n=1 Tax=Actinomortierella ambigua TaxID=1343610 RepID=A0A9P6U4E1_9FUNG|nr:hypothetical protein DFQ27_003686 [Actinomortierella ambigua]
MLGKHSLAIPPIRNHLPRYQSTMAKTQAAPSSPPRVPFHSPTLKRRSVSGNRALWSGFLKRNYTSLKEDHPDWAPKDIRAHVGKLWAASPENPKNH